MKKLLINLRYLLAPASISLALYGVVQGGVLSWLGVFMLGVAIIVDTLVKKQTVGAGFDENGETNGVAWFQNLTMYVMLPLFICLQIALAFQVSGFMAGATSLTELIGSYPLHWYLSWYRYYLRSRAGTYQRFLLCYR
jgi:hypothetical protein